MDICHVHGHLAPCACVPLEAGDRTLVPGFFESREQACDLSSPPPCNFSLETNRG